MKTRTRNALALAASAALFAGLFALVSESGPRLPAAGEGGRTAASPAVRGGRPALDAPAGTRAADAVPEGALLVATVELAPLRASVLGPRFLGGSREIPGLGAVREVCGYDPIDAVRELALAVPAAGEAGDFGLVAAGPLDGARLLACVRKVIEARGGRPEVRSLGGFQVVRDASLEGRGGEIALRPEGPLLLGEGDYLRQMIDAFEGGRPRARASGEHAGLAARLGEGDVVVTAVLGEPQKRAVLEELRAAGVEGGKAPPAASLERAGLVLGLGREISARGLLECRTAEACAALGVDLAEARDAKKGELGARAVGLGAVLEALFLEAKGEALAFRLVLPAEEVALVFDRLAALGRGEADPGAGPGGSSPAPPPESPARRP